MPNAVTHVLLAIIIAELIRDYFVKDKKRFPLHYVLIAGIAGIFPDIDLLVYIFAHGLPLSETINNLSVEFFHPSFTHSIIFLFIFLAIASSFLVVENKRARRFAIGKSSDGFGKKMQEKERKLKKHHMVFSGIFFMIALGWAIHLLLDYTLSGFIRIGLTSEVIGLNLIPATPFGNTLIAGIDAILLVIWLIHIELRHKISRFI